MTSKELHNQLTIGREQGIEHFVSATALAWFNDQEPTDFGADGTEMVGFIPAWNLDNLVEGSDMYCPAMFQDGLWVLLDPQAEPFDLDQIQSMINFDARR